MRCPDSVPGQADIRYPGASLTRAVSRPRTDAAFPVRRRHVTMPRFVLWAVGAVALLSAAYLGFVKLAFEPAELPAPATQTPAEAARPTMTRSAAPPPPAAPLPPRPATAPPAPMPEPAAPDPVAPGAAISDTSAASDVDAVKRITLALAEQARASAHVGKAVPAHVASGRLQLGDDGCKTTDGVRLCLSASDVGGWRVVGTSGATSVTVRGPERLGEPLDTRVNGS